ncbi:lipid acyl hydrolase [Niveomyces insectorum RCEF 264]|uniref:Lipid acyl hydrolase n=1 Tax=Niveomyces insectorum RCEF 264 TaxID=1081102 RepID=A0A162I7E1_9HYPO|nr:lipid acyl hydrolase [Niveomyces insectorum RCEF 264]
MILAFFTFDQTLAVLWDSLHHAENFEDWEAAGLALDHRYKIDTWRKVDKSRYFAWELISDRLAAFSLALEAGHVQALVHLLQSGLVRNLGNITVPALYKSSFAGTKYLIENYILQVCEIIRDLVTLPESPLVSTVHDASKDGSGIVPITDATVASGRGPDGSSSPPFIRPELARAVRDGRQQPLTRGQKRQLFNNLRQSFGRTSLVFQGGSIFGLCHLGVGRALFLRGLLPGIITGTGGGALIASLLGTHTDDELPGVLNGDSINLLAFAVKDIGFAARDNSMTYKSLRIAIPGIVRARWATLRRRMLRFWQEGYFLDVKVLEQCVRDNGGDLTFEEAYRRTGRTLNITVVTGGANDVPTVLNYVTAPNVLIWTAAVASNVSDGAWYGNRQTAILCKDVSGQVAPWPLADAVRFRHWAYGSYGTRHSPLQRVAQLFNVNHFVVSQARPYLVPFLEPSLHSPSMHGFALGTLARGQTFLMQRGAHFVRHRLGQMVRLGILPVSLRRLLLDEQVPGGPGGPLVLVPRVPLRDYVRLLDAPTIETLRYWIRKGEKAVWPAVAALKIRCSVELALEQACNDLAASPSSGDGHGSGGLDMSPGHKL